MNALFGIILGVLLAGSVLVNAPDLNNLSRKLYTTVMSNASLGSVTEAVLATEHKPLNKTVENKSDKSIVALPEQEAASAQPYTDHSKLRKEVDQLKAKLAVIQLKEEKRLVLEHIQTLLTKLKGKNHV